MNDITATMVIPYTHFELDTLEIEDFITAALPDLLDSLSATVLKGFIKAYVDEREKGNGT